MTIVLEQICQLVSEHLIPDLAQIVTGYVPTPEYDEFSEEYMGITVLGQQHGVWKYDDHYGNSIQCTYVDGNLHGLHQKWWLDSYDDERTDTMYKNGVMHGTRKRWAGDVPMWEHTYVDG